MKKWNHIVGRSLIFALLIVLLNFSILIAAPISGSERQGTGDIEGNPKSEPEHDADLQQSIWKDASASKVQNKSFDRVIVPDSFRLLTADVTALMQTLSEAPMEGFEASQTAEVLLPLPLPDGTYGHFIIEESPVMEPGLALKYPEIMTLRALGVDDPTAYARLSWSPSGFQAIILSGSDTVYIDPYSRGNIDYYISYYKKDYGNIWGKEFNEGVIENGDYLPSESLSNTGGSGPILRTYRLAMAATGEYTTYHGGSVAQALAAIVTTMNRVNAIYERELSITMDLIANNDQIIYTDAATDPYTNNNGSIMLSQNQTNLANVIGNANYDIGHVFSTGGGGVAWLAAVCNDSIKARGVTGSSNPVGDAFDVDYVAHEIGHQFAANHTFNASESGACSGGNRNGPTAYEPGSASTILGYAGICSTQDLQPHSDDYFHGINYDEIIDFVTNGGGNSCGTTSSTRNDAPVVEAGLDYIIPKETPFSLTGSAVDPNSDALTYGWEEFDIGAPWTGIGMPNSDSDGNERPIFRSYLPVTDSMRTYPSLANILDGSNFNIGESLPTIDRTMEFRLTVRDNRGGVDNDSMNVIVEDAAGPFAVTAPNTAVNWQGLSEESVMWDVANTNAAPVSCANVNILLSNDGGNTFPYTLANDTPNDGTESFSVPNMETNNARVKVLCADNIFFDIGDQDFTIVREAEPKVLYLSTIMGK